MSDTEWESGFLEGACQLDGAAAELFEEIDRALRRLTLSKGAEEILAPPLISAGLLDRYDYFSSFPHLALLAAPLDGAVLEGKPGGPRPGPGGVFEPSALAPAGSALTPAACYHVYHRFEGLRLDVPRHCLVRAVCFRNESDVRPLTRQRAFTMRESVCLGSERHVRQFLERSRRLVSGLLEALDVEHAWTAATDSFYRPQESPLHLFQRIAPIKREAVASGVALASTNDHRSHFCSIHGITADGRPAHSGCLAFGLERWLHAIARRDEGREGGLSRALSILRNAG